MERSSSSVNFFTLLGLLFIALKLTGCIQWQWWVVLAPIWGQAVLFAACVVIVTIDLATKR